MKIDREKLVKKHNPVLTEIDCTSPLSVGNGELAFTADVTGMQSLYDYYEENKMPLCTMAQWGWHTSPVSKDKYSYDYSDLVETDYTSNGRPVKYPVYASKGNEEVYNWLRHNPHKFDLARIGLIYKDKEIAPAMIGNVHQELDLYTGILRSSFTIEDIECYVETACSGSDDTIAFKIQSDALITDALKVIIAFPYASWKISGADFSCPDKHDTEIVKTENGCSFSRTLDKDMYYCMMTINDTAHISNTAKHVYTVKANGKNSLNLAFQFSKQEKNTIADIDKIFNDSVNCWKKYWNTTGIIQLNKSKDSRALELERRIILSMYLLAIQSSGSMPPQETGLTCNSWYGKAHLEMYFWHEAYLPLWGRSDMMEKSLSWYCEHLTTAQANAAKNGYKGARWTKMVGQNGIDSPSTIAPLLVWQQPHIIYMIYLCYYVNKDKSFIDRYYELVKQSADFMTDFAVKNKEGFYELLSPLIPVQECHPAAETKNPVFEVEYWVVGLKMAMTIAAELNKSIPQKWISVSENMIESPKESSGRYSARSDSEETYTKYAVDHPSFLMAYGVIDSKRMDSKAMEASLMKTLEVWNENSLWGWDFAVMSMTAVRLNKPELAIELLLKKTEKNTYVISGNNRQETRDDLPLYLPGNGSLLLAAALMTAGYSGCEKHLPGFPENGNWSVQFEGIYQMP